MNCKVWIITYLAYACIHIQRSSFPFVQYNIALFYETDEKYIGLLAGITYIIIGIGYIFRVFYPIRRLVHQYFIQVSLGAIAFMIIPITMFLNIKLTFIPIIFIMIYAWFQSSSYSIVLTIVGKHFSPSQNGCLVGLWGSTSDCGNIMGFFICTLIFYIIGADWKYCLLVAGLITLVITILLKVSLEDNQIEQYEKQISCEGFLQSCRQFFDSLDRTVFYFTALFIGAAQYGILLWLPMYLEQKNFDSFEGYISMTFSIFNLLGGTFQGTITQKIESRSCQFRIQMLCLLLGLVPLILISVQDMNKDEKWVLLGLVGLVGFCIGGLYNFYTTNEALKLSQVAQLNIFVSLTLINGGLNFCIGIFQVVLGIMSSLSLNSIFLLFIILTSITMVLIIARLIIFTLSDEQVSQIPHQQLQ